MYLLKRVAIAIVIVCCVGALAQEDNISESARQATARRKKPVRIFGTVSADATKFVEDKTNRVWIVHNFEMLKGYEGQETVLRGKAAAGSNLIQVQSITPQVSYTSRWDDSAFRR